MSSKGGLRLRDGKELSSSYGGRNNRGPAGCSLDHFIFEVGPKELQNSDLIHHISREIVKKPVSPPRGGAKRREEEMGRKAGLRSGKGDGVQKDIRSFFKLQKT